MTHLTVVDRARQGDPRAIATLMNRHLQPQGICVKTTFENQRLHILLEAAEVPPQARWVSFVRRGLENLDSPLLGEVTIYGRQLSEKKPDWVETLDIQPLDNIMLDAAFLQESLHQASAPPPSAPSPPPIRLRSSDYEHRLRRLGTLGITYQDIIPRVAAALTEQLAPGEEVIDAVGGRYRGKPTLLLLTTQRLWAMTKRGRRDLKEQFASSIDDLQKVSFSRRGLKVRYQNTDHLFYFDDRRKGRLFVRRSLARLLSLHPDETIPSDRYGIWINLLGSLLLIGILAAIVTLHLLLS